MNAPTSTASRYSPAWLQDTGLIEDPDESPHVVTYAGFLQTVTRTFNNRERAEQWARRVGVYDWATIKPCQ